MAKQLKPVAQYGRKAFVQPPPNITINKGGISLSQPTVQVPLEEDDPASRRITEITAAEKEAWFKRTGGARELNPDQIKSIASSFRALYRLKKIRQEFRTKRYDTGELMGRIPLNIKKYTNPKEVGFWTTDVRGTLSDYLHEQTGSQRGFQEMAWYTPIFPERTDPPKVVIDKLDRNIESIQNKIDIDVNSIIGEGYNPGAINLLKKRAYLNFIRGK